ncbi:DUF2877 domain-containing protein [Pseudonocardia spinosispora]|uniref:DUF2877 domain-containing protein n=1 Tax=Pseudonocardia spinosispora TaxID=103441 RepID=UPI0004912926|nr:DUF2877 domain-containing protein [Pseudonocardia spinosispora]
MSPVLDLGLGASAALRRPGVGRVLACYRRAAYLAMPGGLCALTTASVPAGPLHARCAQLPPCRPGEQVRTDSRTVSGRTWSLPLDAPTWVGSLPSGLTPAITTDQLADYADRFGGRGPGLTPAGDDLLAGLFLVLASTHACEVPAAIAASVRTTEIAAAFLYWAARGQCISPAHDVVLALAEHGADADVPECARLTDIGASSGRALLSGIRIGLGGAIPDLSTIVNSHLSS